MVERTHSWVQTQTSGVWPAAAPLVVFTDGSCEPSPNDPLSLKAGFGAVLYDPVDGSLEAFGDFIRMPTLGFLTEDGTKRQIVGQSELVPCVCARFLWEHKFKGHLATFYINNDAARHRLA